MSRIGKIAKGLGKKMGDAFKDGKIIEKVKKGNETSILQTIPGLNYQLNPKLAMGIAVGYGALTLGSGAAKSYMTAGIGDISDGELSQMTSTVKYSPLVYATQEGTYNTDNMLHSSTSYGASGDIVFAMHNMR